MRPVARRLGQQAAHPVRLAARQEHGVPGGQAQVLDPVLRHGQRSVHGDVHDPLATVVRRRAPRTVRRDLVAAEPDAPQSDREQIHGGIMARPRPFRVDTDPVGHA